VMLLSALRKETSVRSNEYLLYALNLSTA
jgi:hypothetical protein